MSPKYFFQNPPVKLKLFKSDLAPIGFYFDIFATEMPIPMRIDKIINGESTFLIIPDINKLDHLFEKLDMVINFGTFFLVGVKNLIDFAKIKYNQITLRILKKESIINWFEKSKMISADIPSLIEDFTFLIKNVLQYRK